jgi:hypothetical protein
VSLVGQAWRSLLDKNSCQPPSEMVDLQNGGRFMHISKYLETLKKDSCPNNCEFKKKRKIDIARVPPPDEILGVIISRDPTTDWLTKYRKNRENRKRLFETAIPGQLIERIEKFTREDVSYLREFLNQYVYWTHLHKCFTDKSGKTSIKFKPKNANECADAWLGEELNIAINDKTKFIIALGKDVQKWIGEWQEDCCRNKNIKIIYLPHPSRANVGRYLSWYPKESKNKERIKKRIDNLLQLIRGSAYSP